MNAYLGTSTAGATWPPPWRLFQRDHPQEAAQLQVAWETPALLNNSVMVRDDVPAEIAQTIRTTLLDLMATAQGQAILTGMATARFHAAEDASYDTVRDYVAAFEKAVRPVESK